MYTVCHFFLNIFPVGFVVPLRVTSPRPPLPQVPHPCNLCRSVHIQPWLMCVPACILQMYLYLRPVSDRPPCTVVLFASCLRCLSVYPPALPIWGLFLGFRVNLPCTVFTKRSYVSGLLSYRAGPSCVPTVLCVSDAQQRTCVDHKASASAFRMCPQSSRLSCSNPLIVELDTYTCLRKAVYYTKPWHRI